MIKKVFKTIMIVLVFCIVVFIINFTYKGIWYTRLWKAKKALIESDNFTEIYKMAGTRFNDETGKREVAYSINGAKVKDGRKVALRYDEKGELIERDYYLSDNEAINVDVIDNTFTYCIGPTVKYFKRIDLTNYPINDLFVVANGTDVNLSFKEKVSYWWAYILTINDTKISFVTENDVEYIVLDFGSFKYYFDRETLLAVKEVNAYSTWTDDGSEFVNAYFEYTQGNVTDEDVTLPDLTNYKQNVIGW